MDRRTARFAIAKLDEARKQPQNARLKTTADRSESCQVLGHLRY